MKIIKQKIEFTQVSNGILNNPNISAKAKGIYAYLFSKPDTWDFSSVRICKDFKDGVKSIQAGMRELEENRYLLRERQPGGKMVYMLYQEPLKDALKSKTAESPNGSKPKRLSAKKGEVSNTESNTVYSKSNIDNISNKESIPKEAKASPGVIDFLYVKISLQILKTVYKNSYEYKTSQDFLFFHMDKPQILHLIKTKGEESVLLDWCDEIRKLKEIDEYSEEQIDWIIKFVKSDDFWGNQIISMEKFRKKNDMGVPYFVVMIGKLKESYAEREKNNKSVTIG